MKLALLVILFAVQANVPSSATPEMKPDFVNVKPVIDNCLSAIKSEQNSAWKAKIDTSCDERSIPGYLQPNGVLDVFHSIDVGTCPAFLKAAKDYARMTVTFSGNASAAVLVNGYEKAALKGYDDCVKSMQKTEPLKELKTVQLWD